MSPLSNAARLWLLGQARAAVEAASRGEAFSPPAPPPELPVADREDLSQPRAAFVSIHNKDRLRGCVGRVNFDVPLFRVVGEMAHAAAHEDARFRPVAPDEVGDLNLEISLLSPLFPIRPDQVKAGVHGLLVRRGLQKGLLLPQVARDQDWDADRLVKETCRKAGLPADACQHGATLEAFTAEVIAETEQVRSG